MWSKSFMGIGGARRSLSTLAFLLCVLVSGCVTGIPMSRAMTQCDTGQKFSDYASCIRTTYTKQGRYPNDAVIKAFYANLDEIDESYRGGKLTDAQAKSAAYNAYLNTVEASNRQVSRPRYCVGVGGGDVVCN